MIKIHQIHTALSLDTPTATATATQLGTYTASNGRTVTATPEQLQRVKELLAAYNSQVEQEIDINSMHLIQANDLHPLGTARSIDSFKSRLNRKVHSSSSPKQESFPYGRLRCVQAKK